jgi:hypothetical protein
MPNMFSQGHSALLSVKIMKKAIIMIQQEIKFRGYYNLFMQVTILMLIKKAVADSILKKTTMLRQRL